MDVSGDGDTDRGDTDNEEDEEEEEEGDEDESMAVDGEEGDAGPLTPRRKKSKIQKASKLKPRKSQIDVAAVANEQAALAALEGSEVLRLRLQKKYYSEALNFIRQVEGAMDIMAQLLGSTSKPEVLEAMEFFKVAHEYQFESAKVRGPALVYTYYSYNDCALYRSASRR